MNHSRVFLPVRLALVSSATMALGLAQSIDIDAGALGTQPSAAYAAGAGQPGFWNQVQFNAAAQPLMSLANTATSATITVTAAQNFAFNNAGTTGDDEALMDNLHDAPSMIVISGLAFGDYDIYTYAWAPDSAGGLTNVDVVSSPEGLQVCGGIWPNGHQVDITYVLHTVTVNAGNPDVTILFTVQAQFASCNGIQIVPDAAAIGTNYCVANANSTGSAGALAAFGSNVAAANNVTLVATNLPPNQSGYFLNSMNQGFVPNVGGGQGNLCLGAPIGRYNQTGLIFNSGATGTGSRMINLTSTPTPSGPVAILAGQTWNFQCWYRDNNPNQTSNLTNGRQIVFQ